MCEKGGVVNAYIFSPVSDALLSKASLFNCFLWTGTDTLPWLTVRKKKKKDIFRLEAAERLPKIWGWCTPVLKNDLCVGAQQESIYSVDSSSFLDQAFPRLQRGQWLLLQDTFWNLSPSKFSHSLGLSIIFALYTFFQVSTVWGSVQKTWCLLRGREQGGKSRHRGGGYCWGKQKGSWKLQVLWMGTIKIGTERGKGPVTRTEGAQMESCRAFTGWRICFQQKSSSWRGTFKTTY